MLQDPGRSSAGLMAASAILAVVLVAPFASDASAYQLTAYMARLEPGFGSVQLVKVPVVPTPASSADQPISPIEIGPLGRAATGLSADADGRLMAIDFVNDVLLRIDPATGAAGELIALSRDVGDLAAMSHDSAGSLWIVDDQDLLLVDPVTGQVDLVAVVDRCVEALTWHGASLIGGCGEDLFRIDAVSGHTSLITSYPLPYGSCWVQTLASDGAELWAIAPCVSSPLPGFSPPWELLRIDPATGDRETVAWLISDADEVPFAMTLAGSTAAIPMTAPAGKVLLILTLSITAVLLLRRS